HAPIARHFGGATGAWAPVHGHGLRGEDRERRWEWLLQHALDRLVREGITSISISAYAHDDAARDVLSLNGFGIRVADAVLDLAQPMDAAPVAGYALGEIAGDEVAHLL